MKSLPANLILEKNKLATTSAWLLLVEITLPSATVIRLARNNENVTFQSNTYTAFPFDIDSTKSSGQGEIPQVQLRVSNVTRLLQAYVEQYNGGVGFTVKITVVNSALLAENYAELQMTFDVLACQSDSQWITFTLGAPNPLRRRYPLYRAIANHCNWTYKGRECNYTGARATCKRTLADCQAHSNSARFGGRPGLSSPGIRLA